MAYYRCLYRLVGRLEHLYAQFPDAPADTWRSAICSVAAHIKAAPDLELLQMAGSYIALRNLVAGAMNLDRYDGQGGTYGNRVLDINWS